MALKRNYSKKKKKISTKKSHNQKIAGNGSENRHLYNTLMTLHPIPSYTSSGDDGVNRLVAAFFFFVSVGFDM